jgi:hypothetical protein
LHGNVLRPNFLGRLFLLDSILMSGVIFKWCKKNINKLEN